MRLSAFLLSLTLTAGFVMAIPLAAGAGRITDHQVEAIPAHAADSVDAFHTAKTIDAFDTIRAIDMIGDIDTISAADTIDDIDTIGETDTISDTDTISETDTAGAEHAVDLSADSAPSAAQTYDSTDLYWLSRIISAEARGEPFEGQIAVGNVVLNRVRSREFPDTIKGVIFDSTYGIQFSPVASGTIYQTPTESAVKAARMCLEGYSLSDRALYFFNPALATSAAWIKRTRTYLFTVGGHAFYA